MKIDSCAFLPKARSEGIITKELDGEVLVYDRARDRAHCLNETATAIGKLCDGQTTASEIEQRITGDRRPRTGEAEGSRQQAAGSEHQAESGEQGSSPTVREGVSISGQWAVGSEQRFNEQIVWLALDQLRRSRLLEEAKDEKGKTFWPPAISFIANMSRREAVRRIGLGAAVALPLVISMTAPTPAEAAVSCGVTCHPCNSPIDCCGVCSSTAVPGCGPTTPRCT
jgi:hypothetical protein